MTPDQEIKDEGRAKIKIKKYANRRLYNTAESSYVTLDYLAQMVREGQDFIVEDAKTGEDITCSVLTQIIVEEEAKGQKMLPINFLRQLIRLYGDNLQLLVPRYLEQSMESFANNQEQMRNYMKESFGPIFSMDRFQELSKQNMAFFEQAMNFWNPFSSDSSQKSEGASTTPKQSSGNQPNKDKDFDALKEQMEALQQQFDRLKKPSDKDK